MGKSIKWSKIAPVLRHLKPENASSVKQPEIRHCHAEFSSVPSQTNTFKPKFKISAFELHIKPPSSYFLQFQDQLINCDARVSHTSMKQDRFRHSKNHGSSFLTLCIYLIWSKCQHFQNTLLRIIINLLMVKTITWLKYDYLWNKQ